jgi:hypothetical protein
LSVNNHSEIKDDNLDINTVIDDVRQEFKNILVKREELVKILGEAFEKIHQKEDVCAEIKKELREEIAQGLISRRDIERYCPDEWKQKTKPKKGENEKMSFSRPKREAPPQLLVCDDGNSVVEPVVISLSDSNNNDTVNNEESTNEGDNCTVKCGAGNELELESKPKGGNQLQSQVEELKPESKSRAPSLNQEDRFIDTEFQLPFEDLRHHMMKLFSKNNRIKSISFIARADLATKSLTDIRIWKGDGTYDPLNQR